jgi:hypothetical protein
MDRTRRSSNASACALAVIATAWAAHACAQGVRAAPAFRLATPVPVAVLLCELQARPFGPGLVKVTNVGSAPVAAGRPVVVTFAQAGGGISVFPLSAPLPPGGSQTLPLSGASLLARSCSAAVR